jgi:hypothetical protein
MKKTLCGLIVAAFAIAVMAPASAAVTPRVAGGILIVHAQDMPKPTEKKKKKKKSSKKPGKKPTVLPAYAA